MLRTRSVTFTYIPQPSGDEPTARAYSVDGTRTTLADNEWSAVANPSLNGRILTVDYNTLPVDAGWSVKHFQIEVNGGIRDVMLGDVIDYPRYHYGEENASNDVRTRVIWVADAGGAEVAGPWSPMKTGLTTSTGEPQITVTSSLDTIFAGSAVQINVKVEGFSTLHPFDEVDVLGVSDEANTMNRTRSELPWSSVNHADRCFGPIQTFRFTTPGTHTITFYVTDGYQYRVVTKDIVVEDPDVVFDWRPSGNTSATIYYDPDGIWPDAGANWQLFDNFPDARREADNYTASRLLLKRGSTVTQFFEIPGPDRLLVGPHGPGTTVPVVTMPVTLKDVNIELLIHGIDIQGDYDPTNPDAVSNNVLSNGLTVQGSTGVKTLNATIADMGIYGWGMCLNAADVSDSRVVMIHDCDFSDWHNFMMLQGDNCAVSFWGCNGVQNPLAYRGPDGKRSGDLLPALPDHNATRLSRPAGPVSYHMCYWRGNGDWSSDISNNPNMRWNNGGVFALLNADRIAIEDGGIGFGDNQGEGFTALALVDKVVWTGNMSWAGAGMHYRNILTFRAQGPDQSIGTRAGTTMGTQGLNNGVEIRNDALNQRLSALNVTYFDERTDADLVGSNGTQQTLQSGTTDPMIEQRDQPFPFFVSANHVIHAPNISSGLGGVTDGPLTTDKVWDFLGSGFRYWKGQYLEFANLTTHIRDGDEIDGSVSGADGIVIIGSKITSGAYGVTNTGRIYILNADQQLNQGGYNYAGPKFAVGDQIVFNSQNVATVTAVENAEDGPASAYNRPNPWIKDGRLSTGHAGIGTADISVFIPIRDINGDVREGFVDPETGQTVPGTPSRGCWKSGSSGFS